MSEHRCQTEIWNFENVIFCQQKIFRFDVAMGYPTVMQKILKIKKRRQLFLGKHYKLKPIFIAVSNQFREILAVKIQTNIFGQTLLYKHFIWS